MHRIYRWAIITILLILQRWGLAVSWRTFLRLGAPLPISGGAGETTTTLASVFKEYYAAQGVIDQLNVDTFLTKR